MYKTQPLTGDFFKIFGGIYNDFCQNAAKDYKFEIPPLDYKGFIEYFEKGIIQCVILLEDAIPTGFLAYSSSENMAIELFVIHCLGSDDLENKAQALAQEFLNATVELRKERLVSYPMLGRQEVYKEKMGDLGFKFIDLGVLIIDINDKAKQKNILEMPKTPLPIGFKVVQYNEVYFEQLVEAIHLAFENSSDTHYDERFKTKEGAHDVAKKIVNSIYGKFIAQASKILLFENRVVGFALANITAGTIGNIPLVGIVPEFRGQGISKFLLHSLMEDLANAIKQGFAQLSEVNVSVDLANQSAVKMYEHIGFTHLYSYPQGYLPKA